MPKYTVSEFEGDMPLENSLQKNFDKLEDAKNYAINASTWNRGYRIDVYREDTGFCFLSLRQ